MRLKVLMTWSKYFNKSMNKIYILFVLFGLSYICPAQAPKVYENSTQEKAIIEELKLTKDKFFFIAEESKRPGGYKGDESLNSILVFVTKYNSANCKELEKSNNSSLSCDLVSVSKEQINNSFKGYNLFEGMIFKNIETKAEFSFLEDQVTAVLIFSNQLKDFIDYKKQIQGLETLQASGVIDNFFVIIQNYYLEE